MQKTRSPFIMLAMALAIPACAEDEGDEWGAYSTGLTSYTGGGLDDGAVDGGDDDGDGGDGADGGDDGNGDSADGGGDSGDSGDSADSGGDSAGDSGGDSGGDTADTGADSAGDTAGDTADTGADDGDTGAGDTGGTGGSPYQGGWDIGDCQDQVTSTSWNYDQVGPGSVSPDWMLPDQFGDQVRLYDFCHKAVFYEIVAFW